MRRACVITAVVMALVLFAFFVPFIPVSLPYIDITIKESNSLSCAVLGTGGSYVTIQGMHPPGVNSAYYSIGWGCTPLRQVVNSTCTWVPRDSLERSVKFCGP